MASAYKIIFVGPVGAGKTSAVVALSDIEVVSTEARASDELRHRKAQTTVAMDYGVMNLPGGDRVRLYGTPGQQRFDFMWDILSDRALGVVLLLNAGSNAALADLHHYVAAFRGVIDRTALVVGITHCHSECERVLRPAVVAELEALGLPALVLSVDGRSRRDLNMLVRTLIYRLMPRHQPA